MVASRDNFPLLAELLAEQQRLATPVAQFSQAHDHAATPALEPVYRDLIPLSAPKAGEQYAFEVELDSCTGCKACVSACHSLNGLDDTETWRDVGLVVGGDDRRPFQQTVTTACHHCADPACLNGCPVLAYEKDPLTGIVRHLDDQCIGCQYCILKCPYDVPKYNARLGIVRKCDMCHGRLAAGEAPACVQACPTQAIRIVTVPQAAAAQEENVIHYMTFSEGGAGDGFWAAAPDPAYTRPTTRYVSRRGLPGDVRPADANTLRVQPAHWPLVLTLTLVPLGVGCLSAAASASLADAAETARFLAICGAVAGASGLAASAAHLGQPLRAWRVFLGWRKSWLSREAMVFGAWMPLAAGAGVFPQFAWLAAAVGIVGLFCSAMIYADTRREFWKLAQSAPRIAGSAVLFGAAASLAAGVAPTMAALVLAAVTLMKLGCDARVMRALDDVDDDAPAKGLVASARLLAGPLRTIFGARVFMAMAGGLLLPLWVVGGEMPAVVSWTMLGLVAGGDLAERYLFFRAVDAPKMPGVAA